MNRKIVLDSQPIHIQWTLRPLGWLTQFEKMSNLTQFSPFSDFILFGIFKHNVKNDRPSKSLILN